MMNNFYFFDTSALLQKSNNLFKKKENIIISTTVLDELENIKTSRHKDDLVKQQAKVCIRKINDNINKCEIINFNETMLDPFKEKSLEITNDIKILSAAFWANNNLHIDEIIFVTNDLSLQNIANLFFGDDQITRYEEEPDDYSGYKTVECSDEVLAQIY